MSFRESLLYIAFSRPIHVFIFSSYVELMSVVYTTSYLCTHLLINTWIISIFVVFTYKSTGEFVGFTYRSMGEGLCTRSGITQRQLHHCMHHGWQRMQAANLEFTWKQRRIGECPFQAPQLVSASSRLRVFERVSYQSLLFMYVWRARDFVNLLSFGNFWCYWVVCFLSFKMFSCRMDYFTSP